MTMRYATYLSSTSSRIFGILLPCTIVYPHSAEPLYTHGLGYLPPHPHSIYPLLISEVALSNILYCHIGLMDGYQGYWSVSYCFNTTLSIKFNNSIGSLGVVSIVAHKIFCLNLSLRPRVHCSPIINMYASPSMLWNYPLSYHGSRSFYHWPLFLVHWVCLGYLLISHIEIG